MTFKEDIRQLRQLTRLNSDQKIGELFGVTRQAVGKWKANNELPQYVRSYLALLKHRSLGEDIKTQTVKSKSPRRAKMVDCGEYVLVKDGDERIIKATGKRQIYNYLIADWMDYVPSK